MGDASVVSACLTLHPTTTTTRTHTHTHHDLPTLPSPLQLRGFGDFVRRHLRTALELVIDTWPADEATTVSGSELDRLAFLVGPGRGDPGAGGA